MLVSNIAGQGKKSQPPWITAVFNCYALADHLCSELHEKIIIKKKKAIKLACMWYIQCINCTTQRSSLPFQYIHFQMPNSGSHFRLWGKWHPLMCLCYLEFRSWPGIHITEDTKAIRKCSVTVFVLHHSQSLCRWLYENTSVPEVSAKQNSKELLFSQGQTKHIFIPVVAMLSSQNQKS